VLITADASRRGNQIPMKQTADEAVAECPSIRHLIVHRRSGAPVAWTAGRDIWWHEAVARESATSEALAVPADHPALIIYTSGTTGQPKGTVLTHGGFGMKNAHDWAYVFDMNEGDRMFWVTDLGWLMGPMLITGTLLMGGSVVLFEGTPDYPKPDRLWQLCARNRVTHLGISPTAVRALHALRPGLDRAARPLVDLASSAPRASRGTPSPIAGSSITPARVACPSSTTRAARRSRRHSRVFPNCPIAVLVQRSHPGNGGGVLGDDGKPVRGEVGELVVTRPWPGMTHGFWQDPDRYIETYWSRWPDVWVHGDWAFVDEDGYWFIHGRSDDTLKIAGKRVGPAEIESVLVGHPAVNEAAAIGVPHDIKGETVVCFTVLRPGFQPTDVLRDELTQHVTQAMGKAIRPDSVLFVRELPKTRSAKIMRRVIRATYLGKEPGDLSSLDNPSGINAITEAV
jgi:acetyl-CoA synthetase